MPLVVSQLLESGLPVGFNPGIFGLPDQLVLFLGQLREDARHRHPSVVLETVAALLPDGVVQLGLDFLAEQDLKVRPQLDQKIANRNRFGAAKIEPLGVEDCTFVEEAIGEAQLQVRHHASDFGACGVVEVLMHGEFSHRIAQRASAQVESQIAGFRLGLLSG